MFRGRAYRKLPLLADAALAVVFACALAAAPASAQTLDPATITQFSSPLPIPPYYSPTVVTDPDTGAVLSHDYAVDITEFQQQVLPSPLPTTTVWGYGGMVSAPGGPVYYRGAPGATFAATRGVPVNVQWINNLLGPHLFAVDPTLHWANPNGMAMPMPPFSPFPPGYPLAQSPVPTVPHLHGGEVRSDSDGGPDAWFTHNGITGPGFSKSLYTYPNQQQAASLWYHDHALGITRMNVLAGLAGFYLLSDPADTVAPSLPPAEYDIPVVIQDRSFNSDGSLYFPSVGSHPSTMPYWQHEFFGNTIMVNGKVWPNLDVERRQYRFRLLNGSNARFYNISLSNSHPFTQIASDGGYLPQPEPLTSLLLSPGERAEILVDFSSLPAGTQMIMNNDARTPYPDGSPVVAGQTSRIMRFTVADTASTPPGVLPPTLNDIPELTPDSPARVVTLNTEFDDLGHTGVLLDGQKWSAPVSELPLVGSTEDWYVANITAATHPIHLHLVQFQVVSRQAYDSVGYYFAWTDLNGDPPLSQPTVRLPVEPYLQGSPMPPEPGETGWKDTVRADPYEVLRVRVRWAPQDADPVSTSPGENLFPFDPAFGPGYVWHCHILDHEDNEMMRPLKVELCEKPDLVLEPPTVFWASYWDYYNRELSVTWSVTNSGRTGAFNTIISGEKATNGVTPVGSGSAVIGEISAAASGSATVRYNVPLGVSSFRVFITVTAEDGCGTVYQYP
ncbi:MAG: multicopper oxidase family protein [Thermoleophilia bacterium]